jgi:hypothetical protein
MIEMGLLVVAYNVMFFGVLKLNDILGRRYLRTALAKKLLPLISTVGCIVIMSIFGTKLLTFNFTVAAMLGMASLYSYHLAMTNRRELDETKAPDPLDPMGRLISFETLPSPTPAPATRVVNIELPQGQTVTLPLDGSTQYEIRLAGAPPIRIGVDGKPILDPAPPAPESPRKTAWEHINEEDD